jgi:hypothetical protein
MLRQISPARVIAASVGVLIVLFAIGWATRQDPDEKPYLRILGGGFMFNYRVADVFYGFTAQVQRPLESGSIIEASFENPAGGEPFVVRERVSPMTDRYSLQSPPVRGVEAHHPYKVAIRILDRQAKNEIWKTELSISSQISDEVVPDKPLVIGPGYDKNPESDG